MIGIYARVSTEEQAKTGTSIQDQLRACKEYLSKDELQNYQLQEYIDEGISGEIFERPALSKLRNDSERGNLTAVICFDPDRLSRKLMHQLIITEELNEHGVELLFVNGYYQKTPEGNLFYSLRGAISEFEKAKITERMKRGRLEKARQGSVLRDYNVYGYNYNKNNRSLEINKKESEIVKLIFDLFTRPEGQNLGINGIANYLTKKGIPTKTNKQTWHRQVVKQILQNPVYIGSFYQNKWKAEATRDSPVQKATKSISPKVRDQSDWIEIKCPAIITESKFYKAQELLKQSRRKWVKQGKRLYLLSGLVKCGLCNNTMTGRRVKNWGEYVFIYTDKKNNPGIYQGCGLNIPCSELDKVVSEVVFNWLTDLNEIKSQVSEVLEGQNKHIELDISETESKLSKTKQQKKKLLDLIGEDTISIQEAREYLQSCNQKEKKLSQKLKELQAHKKNIKKQYQSKQSKHIISSTFAKIKNYNEEDLINQQQIIRTMIREIIIYKNSIVINTH
ncbi:recombinase family protein [Natranaerobius thermophilus]|uniref:Resolvase domain n=1 Tax=Natranaerobius thermophilus (strain ATCC BAA-1301 / DSM 18059 / JW/NM-WN-LF) TaxID=457570 RepID=B2A5F7_NATTJ|nr:recombinase family protein [Natranaerobius thermophilus]ACB85312.1 Resolvase domain [Natranaerobius thermophilus JW/NM-WN-LF]